MSAIWAGALNESVGEISLLGFGIGHRLGCFNQVSVFFELGEQLLADLSMAICMCVRVQIVGEGHVGEGFAPDFVISRSNYSWRDALFGGFQCGRCAVHVGARDHRNLIADDSVESGEDIGWDVHARDVAEMRFAVYIRPGDSDEDFAGQFGIPRISDGWVTIAAQADRVEDALVPCFIIARVRLEPV